MFAVALSFAWSFALALALALAFSQYTEIAFLVSSFFLFVPNSQPYIYVTQCFACAKVIEDVVEELEAELEPLTMDERDDVLQRCRVAALPIVRQRATR